MRIEIRIEAPNPVKEALLAGLAKLVPACRLSTVIGPDRSSFRLNLSCGGQSLDRLLQDIAAMTAEVENRYPSAGNINIHVRNIERSEPPLDPGGNSAPFLPVAGFRIVPCREMTNAAAAAHDILLDPAQAFGSGLHPTTRLCLRFLQQVADENRQKSRELGAVLDIGCGSGILTLAALRLGARRGLAVEIDPAAAAAARRNMARNGLADAARVVAASWRDIAGQYDLVMANLVPSVLCRAAPDMKEFLKAEGQLITSGFPAAKTAATLDLFKKSGLRLLAESSLDGWGALLLTN